MNFRTFVEPNSQVILGSFMGNHDLPTEVISGPNYFFNRRPIFGKIITTPQWLTLTTVELPTLTQLPVMGQMDANWSRDVRDFTPEQLYKAAQIPNDKLAQILRNNLELFTKQFVSRQLLEDLVATPETTRQQHGTIARNRELLTNYVSNEIKKRLGGLGLVLHTLELNLILPIRAQREIEDMWQLQQMERHQPALTERSLARALEHSQPTILMGQLSDPTQAMLLRQPKIIPNGGYVRN